MIIDHTNLMYVKKWEYAKEHRFNGAYYYSTEIVHNIIPRVKTDRNWITINVPGVASQHTIVFIHDNLKPRSSYRWLTNSRDLVLVCGVKETMDKVRKFGTPIYLPLSIDVDYVKQFKTKKTKDTAYVGRMGKPGTSSLPEGTDFITGKRREELLKELAPYRKVYAVGRCALEAKVLGCEILPYDKRYPDPSVWEVMDNKAAAKILQAELDRIDSKERKSIIDENASEPVQLEVIKQYYDKIQDCLMNPGDMMVADRARADQLVKCRVVKEIHHL